MSADESDRERYVRARELLLNTSTHLDGVLTHVDNLLARGDVDTARLALRTLLGTPSLLRRIVRDTLPAGPLEPIPAPPGAHPPITGPDPLHSEPLPHGSGRDRLHLVR